MEGIAIEIKHSLMLLESWGLPIERVVLTGGGSRSGAWAQLQANVYGVPTHTLQLPDAAAVGAAILAGVGSGVIASIDEGVRRLVRTRTIYEPDDDAARAHTQLVRAQDNIVRALDAADVFRDLWQAAHEQTHVHASSASGHPER